MNNFFNRILLRLALLPLRLYGKFGINEKHLKSILTVKLMMDDRRATGIQKARNERLRKETNTATIFLMLGALVMGCFFLFAFSVDEDVTRMTIYFSFYIFMLSLFLIADFTYVLVDVKDNYIILPKPVSPSTFLAARLLHIFIHLSKITIPLSIPGCLFILYEKGWTGLLYFIPALLLLTFFTVFVVNATYLLILKVFSPQKFNSIISTIQIGFTVIVFGGYQILPRILDEAFIDGVDISKVFMMWFYPPFWFAGAWKYLYAWYPSPILAISLGLSLIVPLLSIWIVFKYLAPAFHRKLSMIGATATESGRISHSKKNESGLRLNFSERIAKLFTKKGIERGAFIFTWKMTSRNRDFKMKIYPQFGYMIVIGGVLVYQNFDSLNEAVIKYSTGFKLLFLAVIYFSSMVNSSALFQIPYSDQFKAAWIFLSSPLRRPGLVLSGAAKASFAKFCLPIMVGLCIMLMSFFGIKLLPNLLFGLANVCLINAILSKVLINKLPFGNPVNEANQGENTVRNIMVMFILPIIAIPHYFIYDYSLILLCGSIVSFSLTVIIFQRIKLMRWETLRMNVD